MAIWRFWVFLSFASVYLMAYQICEAQQVPAFLNRSHDLLLSQTLSSTDTNAHTSFKPCFEKIAKREILGPPNDKRRSLIYRKLKEEHLFIVDTAGFYLTIDPVFCLELGADKKDTSNFGDMTQLFKNTRGILIRGSIGEKVSFISSFYENQAFLPNYLSDFGAKYDVIPGQGRFKRFKDSGFDYAMASGLISLNLTKFMNVQFGTGKNFIGDGYRSLAISDNAFNYPYLKVTTTFWKFRYTNLFTSFQNLNVEMPTSGTTEPRFQRKGGSYHHLEIIFGKKLNIALFEGMIWNSSDKNGGFMHERDIYSFINPIPFIRPITYGLRQENNALVGVNLRYNLADNWIVYGQLLLDDYKSDKNGFQIGIKAFDLFGVNNLHIQTEINQVSAYTYAHADSSRSFTHYNQAIAHPLGAGFFESVSFLNWQLQDFFVEIKFNYAVYREDSLGYHHNGKNIFKSDNSIVETGSNTVQTALMFHDIRLGYLINPKTNMQLLLGLSSRIEENKWWEKEMQYFYFGIRTYLRNQYYDF